MEHIIGHKEVKFKIEQILKDLDIEYSKIQHSPVYTMEEAEKACNHAPEEGVKTLLLKSDEGNLLLSVLRGDHRLDFKMAKNLLGTNKIRIAEETDLKIVGVEPGGLTPFGYQISLPVLLDSTISQTEYSYINPGVNTETFKMKSLDLLKAIASWGKSVTLFLP